MIRLSKRQIILLHDQLVEETGGMSGIRDDGLLESAIAAPFQYRLIPRKSTLHVYQFSYFHPENNDF